MMNYIFESYSYQELWNIGWLILIFLITFFYFYVTKKVANRTSKGKAVSFVIGVWVFYVAVGSPLHLIGHNYLFSAHMLEQAIVYFVAPPLILIGLPNQLIKHPTSSSLLSRGLLGVLSKPIIASLLFNGLFSLYHYPSLFDYLRLNHQYQSVYHVILTILAFTMWLSILHSKSNYELSELKSLGYIFLNSVLITPVCALIIFSNNVLYTTYINAPQLISFLSIKDDQQLGGIVMKLIQEGVFITIIGILFLRWAKKERKKENVEIRNEDAS